MADQMTYFFEVYGSLPQAGPGNDPSTDKAYQMIPNLPADPRILDIGCGPGRQTLELARLAKGKIIALDNHQPFLDKINKDAKAAGLSQYIETLNQDMNTMNFAKDSFDLIWAEGALYQMGFAKGLKKCHEFLKKNGFLAVTELVWLTDNPEPVAKEFAQEYPDIKNIADNLTLFKMNDYEVIGHFTLPVSAWTKDYYEPMQERVNGLRPSYEGNKTALQVLDMAQQEIDGFKLCSDEVGYEFFITQVLPSKTRL